MLCFKKRFERKHLCAFSVSHVLCGESNLYTKANWL